MKSLNRLMVVGLITAVPQFLGCHTSVSTHANYEPPSHVEEIEGSDLHKVTWTKKAAQRTGLETGKVTQVKAREGEEKRAVPYSSILYTPDGKTWLYKMPEDRTFIRHEIEIDYIEGQLVFLDNGPPIGTTVVTVGVPEIYGSEFEVGH